MCTIQKVLDLTGNGVVDIFDKNLLQDYINGKNVFVNNTEQCEEVIIFTF